MSKQVLMVTGASKGIGLATVLAALRAGYQVVGTSRNSDTLCQAVENAVPELAEHFTAVAMEFDEASIARAVAEVKDRFGRIDVLINNAGYAVLGAVEEFSAEEVRANFEVNVFGLLSVTQAVLPIMREARGGHIINLASISGTLTGPAQGIYSATKASVIMLSEALREEVRPFGIQVTAICPGGVRTDFLDNRSMRTPERSINAYRVVQQTMDSLDDLNHNQSGNPQLLAKVIIDVASMDDAPARLYCGRSALRGLETKLGEVLHEAKEHSALGLSIDD
ncbi:SDR family oxidoreductase [Corynebacterium gerontici]|uniref:Serine 3-dehydrogenase n=1 Tax=Corynebacterium gerontici TaxID=2079234 RepID=A0A3G6J7R0_9CORY|nr:SDR family oxidoreductase [Corynebacterium gerontici]AZA12074.1 Serine 3-dehydrogenase [Corynebacterium gerontici]